MYKNILKKLVLGCMILILVVSIVYAVRVLVSRTPVIACTESDGGYNLSVPGIVTYFGLGGNTTSVMDFCGTNRTIHEFYCHVVNGTAVVYHWTDTCPGNSTCVGGVCV